VVQYLVVKECKMLAKPETGGGGKDKIWRACVNHSECHVLSFLNTQKTEKRPADEYRESANAMSPAGRVCNSVYEVILSSFHALA